MFTWMTHIDMYTLKILYLGMTLDWKEIKLLYRYELPQKITLLSPRVLDFGLVVVIL